MSSSVPLSLNHFDDLLRAARDQPAPQRLLLVFCGVELPPDATPAQRERFAAGQGGTPEPLMCVDKAPAELASFAALAGEADAFGPPGRPWGLVFAAALSGQDGRAPTSADAGPLLERMADSIRAGRFGGYIAFDRQGLPVHFG